MRIFVASGIFHPDSGGPATYLYRLLPELLARGHQVRVLTYGDAPTDGYPYLLTRISFRQHTIRRQLAYSRAYRAGVAWADVTYINNLGLPRWGDSRQPRLLKVVGDYAWERCVTRGWLPQDEDIDVFQRRRYGPRVSWYKTARRREVRAMPQIVVPSEYLRRMVVGWGADPARVHVIYNAIESEPVDRAVSKSQARAMLGWPAATPTIISVARLTAWKGIDMLIDALPAVPGLRLIIAGDGPTLDALKHQAAALADPASVTFLGRVPHERLALMYRAVDYLALYSGYEGLSHVVLEALAAGTPVIASARGGNPEVVRDGENGLLVPHPDPTALAGALQRAFGDDLPTKLASGTQAGLERFSWERLVEHTHQMLVQASDVGKR